jgi:putative transposase
MKASRFANEQIIQVLRQAEIGPPAVQICRKLGVTETTFYRWNQRFAGLGVSDACELRQLRDENQILEQLVTDSPCRGQYFARREI